jgi:hypothetical protein
MTKRHAKPTSAQLAARMYRRLIMTESRLAETKQEVRSLNANLTAWSTRIISQIGKHAESMRLVADHCARLLKEKETLQKQIERMREPFKIVPGEPLYNVQANAHAYPPTYTSVPISVVDRPTHRGADAAPDFQASRHGACAFASSHRAGIRCEVCGETLT